MNFDNDNKDWNMAVAFLQRLDKRLDEVSIAHIEGDQIKTFRGYMAVIEMVLPIINDNEKEEIDFEIESKELRTILYRSVQTKNDQLDAEQKLKSLGKKISSLLYKHNLIFGKKVINNPSKAIKIGMFGKKNNDGS